MALGQLSDEQRRFASIVAAETNLDPSVVVAWVGSESGWNRTMPTHNYLNIGPHRAYPSVDHAANAVVGLIRNSEHYGGIRGAIPRGPGAQVDAIWQSPWDAGHYGGDGSRLLKVWRQLVGAEPATGTVVPLIPTAGPIPPLFGEDGKPGLEDFGWGYPPDLTKGLAKLLGLDDLTARILVVGLGLVFTVAAFGLITLGFHRLTGSSPRGTFDTLRSTVGTAQGVASAAS